MTTFFGACTSSGTATGTTASGTGGAETDWNNSTTFICPGTGSQTVTEITAFIKNVTAYNFRLAIYSSTQTTLIAQGTSAVAATGANDNWQGHVGQASITPNPTTLTGGMGYVLAITSNGDTESDHWLSGASGFGRFVSTDFTGGFTNGSLGSPSAATLVPPIRVGLADPAGPPLILSNPSDSTVDFTNPATFTVSASSQIGATLNYQWKENGTNIASATNASVTINPTGATDQNGVLTVSVWDTNGTTASGSGILRLNINGGKYAQETSTSDHFTLEDGSGVYLMESWSTTASSFFPPFFWGDLDGRGRRFFSDRLN